MKAIPFIALISMLVCSCGPAAYIGPAERDEAINIGYGSTTQDKLTNPVSKVDVANSLENFDTIYDYLRGRVAGVIVSPGPNPSITIRGASSLNLSTEPLIMVDGMEYSDLSSINPREVKSVEVLKDAAASIYGVRGANGVILVTTKTADLVKQQEAEAKKAAREAKKKARSKASQQEDD